MNTDVMFSSKKHDWQTPPDLFNELNKEFDFVMDLAADKDNSVCEFYIDEEMDSLSIPWHQQEGWLWLNPPYNNIKVWMEKCHKEAQLGAKVVALIPNRSDTKWYWDNIHGKYEVRLIKGRVKFLSNGEKVHSAPFPSVLIIFRRKTLFEKLLSLLCLTKCRKY